MRHFLSAALRGVRSDLRVSDSQGAGGYERAGLVEIGQCWSNADEIEERRDEVAVSGGREGKDSREGREERIEDESEVGFRDLRLRLVVTVGGLVGLGGRVEREREKVMRWWSDLIKGVTERLEGEQALENTRSKTLPAL